MGLSLPVTGPILVSSVYLTIGWDPLMDCEVNLEGCSLQEREVGREEFMSLVRGNTILQTCHISKYIIDHGIQCISYNGL